MCVTGLVLHKIMSYMEDPRSAFMASKESSKLRGDAHFVTTWQFENRSLLDVIQNYDDQTGCTVIRRIIEERPSCLDSTKRRRSAIQTAAGLGKCAIVQMLLQCPQNRIDLKGWVPALRAAVRKGSRDTVRLLMDNIPRLLMEDEPGLSDDRTDVLIRLQESHRLETWRLMSHGLFYAAADAMRDAVFGESEIGAPSIISIILDPRYRLDHLYQLRDMRHWFSESPFASE